MAAMLLAYDATGAVVATLDYCVARNADGAVVGLIDFEAHEESGGHLTDIWVVAGAVGSGTWPEWLGNAAHAFTVERGSDGRIAALVHRTSGHRRERSDLEDAIRATPYVDNVRDIRHIVGGPKRPLVLDADGKTIHPDHPAAPTGSPPHLPLIGQRP